MNTIDPKTLTAAVSGIFALVSAAFSYYSGTQARVATEAIAHADSFATRIRDSIKDLSANSDPASERTGTIEIISLYSLAKGNRDEKRDVLYIAAASSDSKLLESFGTMLKNSKDQDDVDLMPEYQELLANTETQTTTPSGTHGAVPSAGDKAFPRSAAATLPGSVARALGDVTPPQARGWIYLGEASGKDEGAQLENGFVSPPSLPATRPPATITTRGYLHLRDPDVAPDSQALGPIVGVVSPGRSAIVEQTKPIHLSQNSYAVWALVSLCPESGECK